MIGSLSFLFNFETPTMLRFIYNTLQYYVNSFIAYDSMNFMLQFIDLKVSVVIIIELLCTCKLTAEKKIIPRKIDIYIGLVWKFEQYAARYRNIRELI